MIDDMGLWLSWLERNFDMVKVGGSSPLSPTNYNLTYKNLITRIFIKL